MTREFIRAFNKANESIMLQREGGFRATMRQQLSTFRKKEDGSVIIFGLYMLIIMLIVGGMAVDTMRAEYQRTKIQYTTDRALLAAASMKQTIPAQDIFDDYFAKAGMPGLAPDAIVDSGRNFRKVTAEYQPENMPSIKTWFMKESFREMLRQDHASGVNELKTIAGGVAVDGVQKVEISLVLDVSGSMGRGSASGHTKLYDLKVAAKDFVDTLLLDQPEEDTYSISIIPFSTQVNAGANLLSKYNISDEHTYSHCVDFENANFNTASLSTVDPLQRTGHFNPWGWQYKDKPISWKKRPCPPTGYRAILPLSGDISVLKNYIDAFVAAGNTSADIGLKWGAALLDPSAQTVVSSLIGDGDIDAKFNGRPFDYTEENILKVIVVMSDGQNTNQFYLKPHVSSGMSKVWHMRDSNGRDRYSIQYKHNPGWWFHTWADSTDGHWKTFPSHNGMEATQMSYTELYNHASIRYVAEYMMQPAYYDYNTWNTGTYGYVVPYTKDNRMKDICAATKDKDVRIFAIGFEVTDNNADKLTECATSAGHFFRVNGEGISEAFASIAAQLHRLRLER